MKLFSLKEMGTGQEVRKEIQCAFNFIWKIMFSSTLLNIVLFLPNKSSTSDCCPNALLNLHFWPLFEICYFCCHLLIAVLWSFYFPLVPWHLGCPRDVPWSLLPSHCPRKLQYPSRGTSSSGCSVATENSQCHESCHSSVLLLLVQ